MQALPPLTLSEADMRKVMAEVSDIIVDHYVNLHKQPVTLPSTLPSLRLGLDEPLPQKPVAVHDVLEQVKNFVLAEMTHNDHPRNFAFVPGPSNFVSTVADTLASAFNIFCGAWIGPSGAAQIEIVTIEWLRQLFGFPETAGGLFVSGGSMANLTCLSVARHAKLGDNANNATIYFSDQTHSSVAKGLKILGFQHHQLRKLTSGAQFRLPLDALRAKISSDRQQGLVPFCVVANAGTTNTGAVDDLEALSEFCEQEGLWLHADGAYGGSAALTEEGKALLKGLDKVHSLAIDPHKWLFQPYEIGCALVRDKALLKDTFKVTAEYLKILEGGTEQPNFSDYGVQLTRGFRALKLWMSLKAFGVDAFREAIDIGMEHARDVEKYLRADPCWEIVTPANLGIVNFRFVEGLTGVDAINSVNTAIADTMILSGFAFVAPTSLRGQTVLRLCTINPRTTKDDIEETIRRLAQIGRDAMSGRGHRV